MHDERFQIVGQALGRGGEAALVELVDQRLQSLLGVAGVDRVIERLPVGVLDPFALAFGQLGGDRRLRVVEARAPRAAQARGAEHGRPRAARVLGGAGEARRTGARRAVPERDGRVRRLRLEQRHPEYMIDLTQPPERALIEAIVEFWPGKAGESLEKRGIWEPDDDVG
jgi:hypothetical protein